ncbi:MAG: hypothetical protein ACI9EW_003525 [Cellvibrionaceae bacterium]|jgi:hypothetical protein
MKKESYTLEIPERLLNQLKEIASASGQGLNDVIVQTLKGGMPPSLKQIPNRFHGELLSLNALGDLELWDIVSAPQKDMMRKTEKRDENEFENFPSLRKAYAFSLLKWRGHPVPSPSEFLIA